MSRISADRNGEDIQGRIKDMSKVEEVGSTIKSGLQMKGNNSLSPSQEELQIHLVRYRRVTGPCAGGG